MFRSDYSDFYRRAEYRLDLIVQYARKFFKKGVVTMKQLGKSDLKQVAGAGQKSSYEFETTVEPDGTITFKFKGWSFKITPDGGRVYEFE